MTFASYPRDLPIARVGARSRVSPGPFTVAASGVNVPLDTNEIEDTDAIFAANVFTIPVGLSGLWLMVLNGSPSLGGAANAYAAQSMTNPLIGTHTQKRVLSSPMSFARILSMVAGNTMRPGAQHANTGSVPGSMGAGTTDGGPTHASLFKLDTPP